MQPGSALKELPVEFSDPAPSTPAPRALRQDEAAQVVALPFGLLWCPLRRRGVAENEVDDAAQQVFLTATTKGLRGGAAKARPFLYGGALRGAPHFPPPAPP